MPEVQTVKSTSVTMTGGQLLKEGITEVNGEKVQKTALYKGWKRELVPANHLENMKQIYDKNGAAGVRAYAALVDEHSKQDHGKK